MAMKHDEVSAKTTQQICVEGLLPSKAQIDLYVKLIMHISKHVSGVSGKTTSFESGRSRFLTSPRTGKCVLELSVG